MGLIVGVFPPNGQHSQQIIPASLTDTCLVALDQRHAQNVAVTL